MADLSLSIVQPKDGTRVVGTSTLAFEGKVMGQPPSTLYYKWYLPDNGNYTTAKFDVWPGVGTHIVTFTAKDVPTDSPADIANAKLVLMAGGEEKIENVQSPCIVHVFFARIVWSGNAPYKLSKANSRLQALTPMKWATLEGEFNKDNPDANKYVTDAQYQKINRLRYRWWFTPQAQGATVNFEPALNFAFAVDARDSNKKVPVLYYQGKLPDTLIPGNYRLTLRVEDKQDGAFGHEAADNVEIVA
jgi:hypothetical protein